MYVWAKSVKMRQHGRGERPGHGDNKQDFFIVHLLEAEFLECHCNIFSFLLVPETRIRGDIRSKHKPGPEL